MHSGTGIWSGAVVALALGAAVAPEQPGQAATMEEMVAKVTAALPEKATVQPAQPRKLLVFTLTKGYRHSSIPLGAKAFEMMGQKTGAYEATSSDDVNMFKPENLSKFDGVLLLSTTGTLFDDPALKQSLLDFVNNGKGLIGIHAATDCFYDWPEYGEMIGGWFDGHPWNEKVGVWIQDPDSPLSAAFGGKDFEIADEIYQFRPAPYSRGKQRVQLALDLSKTPVKGGMKRADKDYAVSWIKPQGKGRVYYCSLGHREEIYWNPMILRYYLDGIQFALGDLKADTTSLPQPPVREPAAPQPVAAPAAK